MKNAKKFLSIILVIVLAFSIFALPTSAVVSEDASKVNVKYAIEKTNTIVDGTSATSYDLSGTAYADKVYALTISVKSAYGISALQLPFYYNQDKLAQITLYDGTELYYSYNGYSTNMGENTVYMYDLGPAWDDAGQYKFDGTTAANSIQTRCYGLGNASAVGTYSVTAREVDQTTVGYDLWTAGIEKSYNVGCGYITLTHGLASKSKCAFMNTLNGKVVTDDYIDIITFYLYNYDGDVAAEEIGGYVDYEKDTTNNIQTVWDAKYTSGTTPRNAFTDGSALANPWAVFVENAFIPAAAAAPVLSTAGRQVKMGVVDGKVVKGTEQLRVVSSISKEDWNNYFANTTNEAESTNKLVEVGIVATQGAFDMTAAQDAAKLGKGVHGDYTVATTTYIQNTGSDYRFGARIEYQTNVFDTTYVAFAKYKNAEGAVAYVFYDASYALAFATNYNTITERYITFLNGQA